MEQKISGKWIKYEAEKGRILQDEGTSYYRLYQDVKDSGTSWPITNLDGCYKDLVGDMMGLNTEGDIFVYYETDLETNKRRPIMYIKAEDSVIEKGTKFVEVYGRDLPIDNENEPNFNVEPRFLPVLLDKLREIKTTSRILAEFEQKQESYKKLEELQKVGVKTEEDILTIYQNYHRRDTNLVCELINGRNIETDFNSLSEDNKVKMIIILCDLSTPILAKLKKINSKGETENLLTITNRDILLQCANDTGLRCLIFASETLLNDKSFIMEASSKLNMSLASGGLFAQYIPDEFKLDLEVLQMATRTAPYKLRYLINDYNYNQELKKRIAELFSNKDYALKLIEYHFKNVLANPKYVEESFTAPDLLWLLDPEILENIENIILCGPEPTKERENLKQKIYKDIKSTRRDIKEYVRKREKK